MHSQSVEIIKNKNYLQMKLLDEKEMKLELKNITPYLPYELGIEILNYQCDYIGIKYSVITGCYHIGVMPHFNYEGGSTGKSFSEFKPLLLPISALTEQLPDGSIPIVELAKIAGLNFIKIDSIQITNGWIQIHSQPKDSFYRFVYDMNTNGFRYYIDGNLYHVKNQLQLFEYLYANHFWLGDQSLFETGEIIDKRTVNL